MLGSMIYGLVLGAGFVVAVEMAPQPVGSVVWWSLVAGQLSWGAAITWRRTRLPFATAAMLVGAGGAAILTVAALLGYVFLFLPLAWVVPVCSLIAVGPICFFLESRLHPREWAHWRTYMEHKSA